MAPPQLIEIIKGNQDTSSDHRIATALIDQAEIAIYSQRITGGKYLINPSKGLSAKYAKNLRKNDAQTLWFPF